MLRFGSKKELETVSNNLKKLTDDLSNITNNVDDINNQFNGYNNRINDIKDNVVSLENELKSFMNEVKITPVIENAKKQIIKDKEELNKKYKRHDLIREKLIKMINNPKDKELLLTNDELVNYNIPNFYLSFVLTSINNYLKNNKDINETIKNALSLNYEDTSLILMILYLNLNNNSEALKWLNNYLNKINPKSTDTTIVKLLDYFKDNKEFLKPIINKLNGWKADINNDNELNSIILNNWYNSFNIDTNIDDYHYIYDYCNDYENLIYDLNNSKIYTKAYEQINNFIKNVPEINIDLLDSIVNSYYERELELRDNILKNELIIKNNGISKEIKHIKNKDIFSIFLICLNSNKYTKKTKEIMLKYSITYINELLNEHKVDNKQIIININNWENSTVDGSNERELINSITEYLNKPYLEEIKNTNYVNFKTIYSVSFILIGFIVSLFSSTIGYSMIGIGLLSIIYFIYDVNNYKKNLTILFNNTLNDVKQELYNLIAEIVDIKLIIDNNLNNKAKLENYLNSLKEE